MTARDLLDKTEGIDEEGLYLVEQTPSICIIDPCKKAIILPNDMCVKVVENDKNSERIYFQCPKIVGDNIDLTTMALYINYENANKESDTTQITDMKIVQDNITFSWKIPPKAALYGGVLKFSFRAARVSGSVLTNEWNTTYAKLNVLEGILVKSSTPTPPQQDIITQLIQNTQAASEQAINNVILEKEKALQEIQASKIPSLHPDGILVF